jgi:hypothetical protein
MFLSALFLATASAAPSLTVAGSCPGPMTFQADGLTPGGSAVILAAAGPGAGTVPAGPCAGLPTGLSSPVSHYGPWSADGAGELSLSPTLPPTACEKWLTVLDLDACAVAPPTPVAGAGECIELDGVNTDDAYNDAVSAGGIPVAMRYVASADMEVDRLEIFTGEATGDNTVGLYAHDAGLDQPADELSSGSWSMDVDNGWQGAALAAPVSLTAGTTYWVVWHPIGGAQWTQAPAGGDLVDYWASHDDLATWSGMYSDPYKFKLLSCGG